MAPSAERRYCNRGRANPRHPISSPIANAAEAMATSASHAGFTIAFATSDRVANGLAEEAKQSGRERYENYRTQYG